MLHASVKDLQSLNPSIAKEYVLLCKSHRGALQTFMASSFQIRMSPRMNKKLLAIDNRYKHMIAAYGQFLAKMFL